MRQDIVDEQARLQRLFDQAVALKNNDEIDLEVRSAFESYLCIRTYAHLETSVRAILLQHVRSMSRDKTAERFIEHQFRRLPNFQYSQLVKLIGLFNRDWADRIKDRVSAKIPDTIDGLVNLRNSIAHGESKSPELSDLQEYFTSAIAIIQIIFDVCISESELAEG